MASKIPAVFDYSTRLRDFLHSEGAFRAASSLGVRQRDTNLIVPPRIGVPLGSPRTALPMRGDLFEEEAYQLQALTNHTLSEMFVEWQRELVPVGGAGAGVGVSTGQVPPVGHPGGSRRGGGQAAGTQGKKKGGKKKGGGRRRR